MQEKIRNVAVIAHVDHGKTTIIDALLKQTHVFRENQAEMNETTILDSNVQERERGITILAKNCAIEYKDYKINIIDTPGHADFSGEVERTLNMADGVLLIVDAQEGPMPQTRFVLKKALELNLKVILVINKIDKQFARIDDVIVKTENLFLELASNNDQLNFPVVFAVGREGKAWETRPADHNAPADITALLDAVIKHVPAPQNDENGTFKMLVSSLDYDPHLGRILVGKIHSGKAKPGMRVLIANEEKKTATLVKVFVNVGLGRLEVEEAVAGDIVCISGLDNIKIGETITDPSDPEPLPTISVSEPTLHIDMGANTSPFAGKEGEFSTSRQIEERLNRELETNLSLRVEKLPTGRYKLSGKGELHLSVLMEGMRREGYEMEVGKPEVITKVVDGEVQEPIEEATILVPTEFSGVINQELGKRFATLLRMEPINDKEIEFVWELPTRAILGLRSVLLTATKGTVIFNSVMIGYKKVGKELPKLRSGVLIASESGEALTYGLKAAQERGVTFVNPATKVYQGMIIGQNVKPEDIEINVCKGKKLTNMRSASADDIIKLAPAIEMSLEQCLDFLENDELLEITPLNLRLRKRYLTDVERKRHKR